MASSVIHMAVANELNKILKYDNAKLLIGSIAPDISKEIGESKLYSHFLVTKDNDIPQVDKFLEKYKDKLCDDFVMGYFIHIYTDYLWFKYFVPEFLTDTDYITKLDGTVVKCEGNMLAMYIYNDYTDLNTQLLDKYDLDCSIFYNELPKFDNIIEEIPMDKLNVIVDKVSVIIENSKVKKELIFDINNVNKFIETCIELTLAKLKELYLI